MGGHYPSSDKDLYLTGGREMDSSYAIKVINDWPTEIVFNPGPVCQDVSNGQTLAAATPKTNPVRAAYTLFFEKEGKSRTSWDLCTVLYAVRGTTGPEGRYFDVRQDERLTLSRRRSQRLGRAGKQPPPTPDAGDGSRQVARPIRNAAGHATSELDPIN